MLYRYSHCYCAITSSRVSQLSPALRPELTRSGQTLRAGSRVQWPPLVTSGFTTIPVTMILSSISYLCLSASRDQFVLSMIFSGWERLNTFVEYLHGEKVGDQCIVRWWRSFAIIALARRREGRTLPTTEPGHGDLCWDQRLEMSRLSWGRFPTMSSSGNGSQSTRGSSKLKRNGNAMKQMTFNKASPESRCCLAAVLFVMAETWAPPQRALSFQREPLGRQGKRRIVAYFKLTEDRQLGSTQLDSHVPLTPLHSSVCSV